MKKIICLISFLLILYGCPSPYWSDNVSVWIMNNSDRELVCFFPTVTFPGCIYPDTRITFRKPPVQYWVKPYETKSYDGICANDISEVYKHYKTDTLSFFIFDNDRINLNGWDSTVKNDGVLVRYDISVWDMERLRDGSGKIRILYPPDESMKDIKMWPPYEEVVQE